MAHPTLHEIKAANVSVDDNGYLLLTLTRPVGPYLAWLWLRIGLTPRHVNYLSIVLGLLLLATAASGGRDNLILATALCFLWQAIDVSDGTMARALAIRDNFGGFVDYASGMLLVAFLPLCLGIGIYRAPEGSLAALLAPQISPDPAFFIAAGGAISAISLYMRLINRVLQIRFGDSLSESGKSVAGRLGWLRDAVKNFETVGGVQAVVFFAGAALGLLEIALTLYLASYVLLLLGFAVSVYRHYGERRAYL